jgi:hypothetical protein
MAVSTSPCAREPLWTPVGARAHDDRRECLGGEIECELAISHPPLKERDHRVQMLAIESRERIIVAECDSLQQAGVVRSRWHHPIVARRLLRASWADDRAGAIQR